MRALRTRLWVLAGTLHTRRKMYEATCRECGAVLWEGPKPYPDRFCSEACAFERWRSGW